MEITQRISATNNINIQTPISPEPQIEAPIRATNGAAPKHHHHHALVVIYRECLKNHAAGIGGHAVDGCGEFMPSPSSNPSEPTSLNCAACGCHRNFHRRDPEDSSAAAFAYLPLHPPPAAAVEFQPHNRHHPPPPPPYLSPDDSCSPPPISSSCMLLALYGDSKTAAVANRVPYKRFRTKFTRYQKERMLEFAEKLGWRMQKAEDVAVREFCRLIGVDKGVFKVWMHNNKNSFSKKDQFAGSGVGKIQMNGGVGADNVSDGDHHRDTVAEINNGGGGANGSSSLSEQKTKDIV